MGDFKKNLEHGQGTMQYLNGNRYSGQWIHGKRHGLGEFRSELGDIFVGSYAEGYVFDAYNDTFSLIYTRLAEGQGILTFRQGAKFIGRFSKGKKQGPGCFSFADGRTLEGY